MTPIPEMPDIETLFRHIEDEHLPESAFDEGDDYDDYAGEREEFPPIIDDGSFADD